MDKIRTLGLYQPYATLMLPPYNKIETRWVMAGKKPPFPLGKYVIYSTKKFYSNYEFEEIAGERLANYAWREMRQHDKFEHFKWRGYAIGIGELYEIKKMEKRYGDRAFVDVKETTNGIYTDYPDFQLWALFFRDVKRIKPFPFKGKQGVGFLSKEDEAKIEYI